MEIEEMIKSVDYYVWIWIGLGMIIIYFIYKTIKLRKKKKVVAEPVKMEGKIVEEPPIENLFQRTFGNPSEDIIENIRRTTELVNKDSSNIEQKMTTEFENYREELKKVNADKEKIKSYGMDLAKIFRKYEERENYLTEMLFNLERMLDTKKRLK